MRQNPKYIVELLLAVAAVIPLALCAYLGQFLRLMWDDYCYFYFIDVLGFWKSLEYIRSLRKHGGWLDLLIYDLVASHAVMATRLILTVTILLWLAGIVWMLFAFARHTKIGYLPEKAVASLSALILAGILFATPSWQLVFWMAGVVRYTLPLALLSMFFALLLGRALRARTSRRDGASLLAGAILCFACAGFAEMFLVFQVVLLLWLLPLLLIVADKPRRVFCFRMLCAGIAASALGGVIQLSSPGIQLRLTTAEPTPGIETGLDFALSAFLPEATAYIFADKVLATALISLAIGVLICLRPRDTLSRAECSEPATV